MTSPSRWLLLLLGSWDTHESFSQIRLRHPETALKLQFIPALTMELTWEGQGHCDRLSSFSSFEIKYTQTRGFSRLVALPPSFTSSSSRSLIPQTIIPCLTSHTVLSLEQTAHPHRHGNSGTTAGSLVLLGVGHLNHSFPLSLFLCLSCCYSRSSTFCTRIPSGDPASMHTPSSSDNYNTAITTETVWSLCSDHTDCLWELFWYISLNLLRTCPVQISPQKTQGKYIW